MNRLNKELYSDYKQYPERILQFGEGNFMRAFVDWMFDQLNEKADFNSSVVAVQPIGQGLANMINEQDGLYTLYLNEVNNGKAVSEHKVINCISRVLNMYEHYDEYLKVAENPELRFITSNTTEAGIAFDENDKLDVVPQNSYPGKLTAFLYHRYQYFKGDKSKGFIIIPCELIDRNGEKLKEIVLKYIKLWNLEEGFEKWINEANTFCCSLVDRVVPGYPRDRIEEITKELGYEDKIVVEAEKFHFWVIEGPQWIKEELPFDKIGLDVLFVDDMTPYRTRKVRILNGTHTTMVPVAYLYGIDTVREAVEDDVVGKFVDAALHEEIVPTLDLPKEELETYSAAVINRFRNPFIKHYLMSISLNSMSKYKTRVLPSLTEYLKRKGELPKRLVFSLAATMAFYKGERNGEAIALNDNEDILDMYKDAWAKYDGTDASVEKVVTQVLAYEKNWEKDLNKIEGLTAKVTGYLTSILNKGMKEAVKEVL
jgi:tagaturonate reductase